MAMIARQKTARRARSTPTKYINPFQSQVRSERMHLLEPGMLGQSRTIGSTWVQIWQASTLVLRMQIMAKWVLPWA
jgi:hypothetical protein